MVDTTLVHKIVAAAASRYAGHSALLLFGSHATGKINPNSDIDIIVLYSNHVPAFRERFRFGGDLYDALVYDYESLNGAIHMARTSGDTMLISAVCSAQPIPTHTDVSFRLQLAAQRLRRAGPVLRSHEQTRHLITGILDDLEYLKEASEITMLTVQLYSAMVESLLDQNGVGGLGRREAARALSDRAPEAFARLGIAFKRSQIGKTESLVGEAWAFLEHIGGPLREGFKTRLPDGVRVPLPLT